MHKIPDIEPFKQKLSTLDEQMAAADFFSDAKRQLKFHANTKDCLP